MMINVLSYGIHGGDSWIRQLTLLYNCKGTNIQIKSACNESSLGLLFYRYGVIRSFLDKIITIGEFVKIVIFVIIQAIYLLGRQ